MDNLKDNSFFVRKISEDLAFIVRHTNDIDKEELSKNEVLLDSMMFRLIQISENAKRLSEDYKAQYKEIPWIDIYGMRNRIIHDYGNIDIDIIYSTLKDDIPELLKAISEGDN